MAPGIRDEDGIATPVEMMYLLIFCLAVVLFIGFVGRLQAAGVEVTNTAQAAARAASQAPTSALAQRAANDVVNSSSLTRRCEGGASVRVSWVASPSGSWQGGSVTVQVTCTVDNQSLAGVWAPGSRSVSMSDTQPIDRYQR